MSNWNNMWYTGSENITGDSGYLGLKTVKKKMYKKKFVI